jgi:hypothetical protein
LQCWDWPKARAGIEFIFKSFFPSVKQLHALIDLVPELRDERGCGDTLTTLSLHVSQTYLFGTLGEVTQIEDWKELHDNIFEDGFGWLGDETPPTQMTTLLSFLNLHPDLVGKYVDSIFAPSDCGDKDWLAVLNGILSVGPLPPPMGHRFCIGSHSATFQIEDDTPSRVAKLTVELHSNAGLSCEDLEDGLYNPMRAYPVDTLVEVLKYWNFPAAIVSALEAQFDVKQAMNTRGLQFEFSGDSPRLLTCTVRAMSLRPLILHPGCSLREYGYLEEEIDAIKKNVDATNELFCYFNRDVTGFSVECETFVSLWSESSAGQNLESGKTLMIRPSEFQESLRALEKHTAAGPMLDAAEAASLCTVPLKPYQSQTVRFMADAEQNERGLQSAYWMALSPGDEASKSLTALFSPVTGEIIVDGAAAACMAKRTKVLPPASRGGFLFEAMGLGKTVEVIALLAKNPPPPALPLRLTIAELASLPPAAATGAVHIAYPLMCVLVSREL